MANVSKLKEKARLLEQKEQWKDALDTYQELVDESEGEDSGLWNRIGDLHTRLGQTERAVNAYEQAVERYIDAGLHNNAIALCNKILRAAPTRIPVYLKLGQISAAQGFLADARHNFLQYAERMQRTGQIDDSFAALKEFADLSPGDTEIRRLLADQLRSHDRSEEAVEQLRLLLGQLESLGRTEDAGAVRDQILTIDPDADLAPLGDGRPSGTVNGGKPGGRRQDQGLDLLPTIEVSSAPPASASPAAPAGEEIPDFHIDIPGAEDEAADVSSLEGFEPTQQELPTGGSDAGDSSLPDLRFDAEDDESVGDAASPAAPTPVDTDAEQRYAADDAALEFEISPVEEEDAEPVSAASAPPPEVPDAPILEGFESTHQEDWDDEEEDGGDGAELPFLGGDSDLNVAFTTEEDAELRFTDDETGETEESDASAVLPFLSMEDEWEEPASASAAPSEEDLGLLDVHEEPVGDSPAGSVEDRVDRLHGEFRSAPGDAAVRDELVSLLREQGRTEEAAGVLENAHRALASDDRHVDAVDVVRTLIELRAADTAAYQKQVEYAFRSGDRDRLIQAYLDLGRHLESGDSAAKAVAVYERVLELDSTNSEARSALASSPGAQPSGQPPATEEGYVDLAALIFDDEIKEASTRFIVEEDEPTGDEDRDFADMLSRFRQKVAENIGVEDSTSHYDLGLAFKDMGLLDEAISQFQVALRGGANPLATLEVLGECFIEKGQFSLASRVLDRALQLPGIEEQNLVGVYYWRGRCDETLGRTDNARDNFERVLSLDLRFRDAATRLDSLRTAG